MQKIKTRSQSAYLYCQALNFENYLRSEDTLLPEWTTTKAALKKFLNIESLRELDDDSNTELQARYNVLLLNYRRYVQKHKLV